MSSSRAVESSVDDAESATLARLRAREALLTEAEGIIGIGSYVWELGVKGLWSDAFYRLLGREPGPDEPDTELFYRAVHPDDLPAIRAGAASLIATGIMPELEYRIIRHDNGEVRYLRGSGCAYRDAEGKVQRIVGAVLDITETKRARLQLEQAVAVTRAAEELAHSGSFIVRLDPPEVAISEGLRKLTGVSETTIDSRAGIALVHPDDRARQLEWWARLRKGGHVEPIQTRILTAGGQTRHFYTCASITPFRSDGGERVVGTTLDITERVELEQDLQRAAKLEAVGTLAAGVAHDFNNYLMVVGSALEQLPRADALTRERLIDNAQRAVTRCAELTRQLLGFARCQPLRPEVVDVCAIVEDLQELFRQSLGRRAELQIQTPPCKLYVRMDARQLEQMLANLIVNAADAIEASRAGLGEVRIIADQQQLTAAMSYLPDDVPAGRYTRIRVEDNGGGVAPEFLPRIFEPYFTTKPRGRGTGLGLSAVYGMTHQNGGVVTVEALSEGTRFALWFPLLELPPLRAAATGEGLPWRILVVDDVPELATVTSAVLRDAGFEVVVVPSGLDALAKLAPHSFDLVLSDIQMPGTDGYALADEIRVRYPGLPVVLMSGHACGRSATDPGPAAVLQKPFSRDELVAFVSAALAGPS